MGIFSRTRDIIAANVTDLLFGEGWERREAVSLPPLLIMQGELDDNVLPAFQERFAAAYRAAGYHLIESLDEGDHSHFAFGSASRAPVAVAAAVELRDQPEVLRDAAHLAQLFGRDHAIGGGHVLHLVCDLTIAADNARFGQTGPRVGSFDGGYGMGLLARTVQHAHPHNGDVGSAVAHALFTAGHRVVHCHGIRPPLKTVCCHSMLAPDALTALAQRFTSARAKASNASPNSSRGSRSAAP